MRIGFHTSDKSGDQSIAHDLNFQNERYETKHTVVSATMTNSLTPAVSITRLLVDRPSRTPKDLCWLY